MDWLVKLLGKVFAVIAGLFTARQWGKETQKRKQAEANNKVLRRYEEINTRPKFSRGDLYKRLRRKK